MRLRSPAACAVATALLLCLGLAWGLLQGTAEVPAGAVLRVLLSRLGLADAGDVDPVHAAIVGSIRAPRAVLAGLVGAALALAGAQLQGLFRNPLASPDLLGVSSGAALGAVLALVAGLPLRSLYYTPLCALLGALASLVVVERLGRREGETDVATLLLAGVALSAFIAAVDAFLLTRAFDDYEVARQVTFWLMGGLVDRNWVHVLLVLPGLAIGVALAAHTARDLDLILEGEEVARSLGVDVARTKWLLLLSSSLLTASAVAVSGVVGFVGLIVPHLLRLLVGPSHRALLPLSFLAGAAFLVLADGVARTALAPEELSLGVVTAFVGAPFFLFLLRRHRRHLGEP